MASTDTHLLLERKADKSHLIVEANDPRFADLENYRVVSALRRDRNYQGIVFQDKWGGVWRQSEEATNISDAMEKWL